MSPTYHILSKQEIGVHQLSTTLQRNCKRRQQGLHSPRSWIFIDFDADSFKDWSILDLFYSFTWKLPIWSNCEDDSLGRRRFSTDCGGFSEVRIAFPISGINPLSGLLHTPHPSSSTPSQASGVQAHRSKNLLLILINPISTKIHI